MIRILFPVILLMFFHVLTLGNSLSICQPDTVPPPPPGNAAILTGPSSACIGDTSVYSLEVPLGCVCQWSVNGEVQPDNASTLFITWTQPGSYVVSAVFICDGQSSDPQSVNTYVGTPSPSPVQGPGESCEGSQETYTTTVGPGETCQWWVDGNLQSTSSTSLTVTWTWSGNHLIEVMAVGGCGISMPTSKTVSVLYVPDVFLGNDTILQPGQTLLLDAGNPGCTYLWSTGATSQTILVSITGNYSVVASNFCGADSDEIEVTILVGIPGLAPEPFSCITKGWNLILLYIPNNYKKMEIYDITGRTIYTGNIQKETSLPGKGIYILKVISSGNVISKKIIIK